MSLKLKRKFSLIVLLLWCITVVSCSCSKNNTLPNTSPNISSNTPQNTPEIIEDSLIPSKVPKETENSNNSKRKKINVIYGKWKILDMIGTRYIYGDFSMKDYVGGIVTIHENYIETDLPLGKWKLENPVYKLKTQNETDFWKYRHASIHNGFGFKSEQVKLVKVFNNNDEWDKFGQIFWIRNKKHLIFLGPVYFLAEKIE